MSSRPTVLTMLALGPLVALGCASKGDTGVSLEAGAEAPTDWALEDVNATSPTAGQVISPSDLRGQVSVWYFGHST